MLPSYTENNLFVFLSLLGANRQVDHFVTLTGVWFSMCVLPLFYFMANASFRRDLEEYGFLKALYYAVSNNHSKNGT